MTFLVYQLVMLLLIWIEDYNGKQVKRIRRERLCMTFSMMAVCLLTVGGYFIGTGNRLIEWVVGLLIFSVLCGLFFRLVDLRQNWFDNGQAETEDISKGVKR